jgi:hypothetical protein
VKDKFKSQRLKSLVTFRKEVVKDSVTIKDEGTGSYLAEDDSILCNMTDIFSFSSKSTGIHP